MDPLLPEDLKSVIGKEKVDFSTEAKRMHPRKRSIAIILVGSGWTAFTGIFLFALFGPLIRSGQVTITVNDVPTTATWNNFEPILVPTIIIGLFTLVGLFIITFGFISLYKKGGYFVGTENRLILYRKGNIKTYDWEQFTGNMQMNSEKGDLSLELRSGRMMSRKKGPDYFVPDTVELSGVPDVLEIERACRKRIKENDPTPKVETV